MRRFRVALKGCFKHSLINRVTQISLKKKGEREPIGIIPFRHETSWTANIFLLARSNIYHDLAAPTMNLWERNGRRSSLNMTSHQKGRPEIVGVQ